jgi:hypothetical protein
MNVTAAKKRAKAHAELNRIKDEPTIRPENYNVDIATALVWYTEHTDDKKRRKFAIEHFAKLNRKNEVLALNKASDFDVRQIGIMCRLISTGNTLSEQHMALLESRVAILVAKHKVVKEVKQKVVDAPTAVVSIQERMDEKARELAGEIEGAIDEFVLSKGKTTFSTKNYLLAQAVSAPVAKRIGDTFIKMYNELADAINGEDEQLIEGYSNFSKRELKGFHKFVGEIVDDCHQMVQTAKAVRAPRKRKPQSPTKLVSKMKFLREFADLGLKSVKPESIIGSTEVWYYNTKYRRVGVYKGEGGNPLSVKGTTIIGFDVKDSQQMTLRKPEEFFKGLALGKRALNNALKKLTTKPSAPNGRINEECILLGAF